MRKFFLIIFLLLIIFQEHCLAGTFTGTLFFEGNIQGYEYDSTKINSHVIGKKISLENVEISILENGKEKKKTCSNGNGNFSFHLKLNHLFNITFVRQGYNSMTLVIDTRSMPALDSKKEYTFKGVNFFLNSAHNPSAPENEKIGKLFYNSKKGFIDFLSYKKKGILVSLLGSDKSAKNFRKAVLKNKAEIKKENAVAPVQETADKPEALGLKAKINPVFNLKPNVGIKNLHHARAIILRKEEVKKLRAQLEKDKLLARSQEDSLLISGRETKIKMAESEIENAKRLIDLQQSEINTQKELLYVSITTLVLMLVLLLVLYKYYKIKKRTYTLLEDKNQKIFDSINYAKRIQQSILTEEKEIKEHLPESFVYYQPKDLVSGDFYWFSHHHDKIIIAAIDCTGHGVPGAFMSLIGNTLLHEIILEKQITDPGLILQNLDIGVSKALRQNKEDSTSRDGMEMSLCVIDKSLQTIQYAGAKNPIYLVYDNTINIIRATMQSIGGMNFLVNKKAKAKFVTHTIAIQKGMSVYLFTDGYMDQFGGEKNTKFNNTRFKQMLLNLQNLNMENQKESLHKTLMNWKGNGPQIDDILIIGVRFD